jgi:two-component system cell cycle response regulator
LTSTAAVRGTEAVSLRERLRYLRALRTALAAAVVLDAALLPAGLTVSHLAVVLAAAGYLAVSVGLEAVWSVVRFQRWAVGSTLAVDAAFLTAGVGMTGGDGTLVRTLVLVHLGAVMLLASRRTGIRLAAWYTALQLGLAVVDGSATGWRWTFGFLVALWVLATGIATIAAVNERELRRGRYELEQLAQMGRAFEDANDRLSVADVLVDTLVDTFAFRRVALFEVDGTAPRMLTCRNLGDALVVDFGLPLGSVLATASARRETLVVPELDDAADPWLTALMPNARNLAIVPLVADAVVAVLVLEAGSQAAQLDRRMLATAERFASHAALAMRNANLLAQMQELAVTDGLTSLSNRRAFDTSLDRELQRAARTDGRLSVVLLDIDHFKALNDTHGHLVGDAVLRQIAAALKQCGREYDTIARYGGEEFAAVLPGCSSALAAQVAERLRRGIAEARTDVPVTASAGVATYPYDGIDVNGLLDAADQALYDAKRRGRNQVRSAEEARSAAAAG